MKPWGCGEGLWMNAEGLIFDMDGTLWDSAGTVARAWNTVLERYPEVKESLTAEKLRSLMGMTLEEIGDELFPYLEPERRYEVVRAVCAYENEVLVREGGTLYEGLEKTLQYLQGKGIRLFVVSNCQDGYIQAFFQYFGFGHYFEDFECAGRTGQKKGENILEVMRRNHLQSAYYIGDTQHDYEATRKACIPFIHAEYGFGRVKNCEYRIYAVTDLMEMF